MKKGLLAVGVILAGVIGLALLFGMWAVRKNNNMVKLSNAMDAQWAQVQNVYQRRADLIPNLVNTVQGAANFEKSTLQEVVNARASVGQVRLDPSRAPDDPAALQKFQAAQDQLSSALSRLLVVVEKYPDLRANQNFLGLQTQLEGTENRISVERGKYNTAVQDYNTYIQQFPNSIIAGLRNFRNKPYFEATQGAERPPNVNFDFGKSPAATNP
ncbi:MAG TPA: LemA family protein [Verrucomicrobiae bacterium]